MNECTGPVGQSQPGEDGGGGKVDIGGKWLVQDGSAPASASMCLPCATLWTNSATWDLIQTVCVEVHALPGVCKLLLLLLFFFFFVCVCVCVEYTFFFFCIFFNYLNEFFSFLVV